MKILTSIIGISVLVLIHEAGHYFSARAFGMRVLRFSVGFGPTIAKWQPAGSQTVFQIALIPFLAYVQIAGMNPAEDNDPNDPSLYPNKGVFARFFTILAGPFANYLAACFLVLAFALSGYRLETPPHTPMTVEQVQANSPAAKAGMKAGDVIVQADGKNVRHVIDLIEITGPRAGKPTSYVVERAGQRLLPMTVVPENIDGTGRIGIVPKQEPEAVTPGEPMPFGAAVVYAIRTPYDVTMEQLAGLSHMAKKGSTEGFVGPVGMVKMMALFADSPVRFGRRMILITIALGLFNLFPLPALDGGRLVFLGYEIITKKRANERVETLVHTVGLVFLLCMIALVTLRDVAG